MCQLSWAPGHPDVWLDVASHYVYEGISEIDQHWIGTLGKAHSSPVSLTHFVKGLSRTKGQRTLPFYPTTGMVAFLPLCFWFRPSDWNKDLPIILVCTHPPAPLGLLHTNGRLHNPLLLQSHEQFLISLFVYVCDICISLVSFFKVIQKGETTSGSN